MQSPEQPVEEQSFTDYQPAFLDAIHVPRYALYIVMAAIIVVVAAYAIVGHLIDDLLHDFADWAFGLKAEKSISDEELEECELETLDNVLQGQEGRFAQAVEHQDWHVPQVLPGMKLNAAPPLAAQHPLVSIQDSADKRSDVKWSWDLLVLRVWGEKA